MPHPSPPASVPGRNPALNAARVDILLGALAFALYGTVALFMVFNGALNVDEGFYGLSSRAALSGLLPYRDFGYTQLPLFPYLNGAVMKVIGFGFIEQRLTSALWASLTIALGSTWLWRHRGRLFGLGYVALMVSGLQWMYFAHIGKTNALVGLLVMGSVIVLLTRPKVSERIFATSLLGVVAIGCRLPVAPFFLVLWAGLLARNFSMTNLRRAVLWPAFFTLILIVPFAAAAPRSFLFWALHIHEESRSVRNWHLDLHSMIPLSPALCLMWLLFMVVVLSRRFRVARPLDLALLGLFVALACNVLPAGAYPEYPAPLVPSFIFVLLVVLADMRIGPRWQLAALATFSVVNLTIRAPLDFAIYGETRKAAAYVRQFQAKAFPFAGGANIVALEAGVPVDDWMVMAPFCCTESYADPLAARRHLATPDRVGRLMADPRCDVLVMYADATRNLVWSMPTFQPISDAAVGRWKTIIARNYVLEYGDETYAVFVRRSLYNAPAEPANNGNPPG